MKNWKTYALLALFCLISTMATRAQERKEFKFENGIVAFWVGAEGEWGVEDANGKLILPKAYGKMWCYGNLIYCKDRKGSENKHACALYDYKGNCKISEEEGYTILDFVKYNDKWIATATRQKTVFDENGDKLYEFKEEKDSNNFRFLRNSMSNEIIVDSGLYWGSLGFMVTRDYILTHQGEKKGVINFDGSPVLPNLYGDIVPVGKKETQGFRVSLSSSGGPEGFFDRNGNCLIPIDKYSSVSRLSNGMFQVVENGKAGIVDSLGNVKFTTNYRHINLKRDEAGNYYYETSIGNGKGKMTLDGEVIEEPMPTRDERIKQDDGFKYIQVTDINGLKGVNDTLGCTILPCEYDGVRYDELSYMKISGYWITKNGCTGFADSNGKVIIPCDKYHRITDIRGGGVFFVVEYMGKKGLCDKNGMEIIKPLYDDIDAWKGLIKANNGIKQGVLDVKGNVIVPIEYTSISYNEKLGNYYVELFKKKGIYSLDGKEILAPKYDYIKNIDRGYIVDLNGKKGVYDKNGREVMPPNKYDDIKYNSKGYYDVELNGKEGACDKNGKEIITPKFNDLYYSDLFDVFEYKDASGEWVSLGISLDKNGNTYENPNFAYDKYFDEGNEYFARARYGKAAKSYKKALEYKQTALAYYNVAASYYNQDKYEEAITYFQYCLNNDPGELEDRALELINKSRQYLAQKEARRQEIAEAFISGAIAFAAGVASASMGVNTPTTSGNMDYLLDPNYAIWQAQQQQAEFDAINQQLINLSIWQTEQQEYETYLLMTSGGTSMTFDEWKALAAQAAMNESFNSDMSYFISDDPSEMEYKGKLSPDQYQAAYRSYENSAAGYYRALTTGGVRNQDKDGNIQGKTVGQISGGGYATWKQGLSKAQAEMRRIRQEAAQYGVTIQQSQWETATVSY